MKFTSKIIQSLFLVVLVIGLLIILKGFLIPFSYGLLIALIVYPICKKLESKKVPRSIAIFISIFLVIFILGAVIFIFVLQLKVLNNKITELTDQLNLLLLNVQKWVNTTFGLSIIEQDNLIINTGKTLIYNMGNVISGSFSIAAETFFNLIIIPLYAILILFYRGVIVEFISSLFGEKYKANIPVILSETILVYFNYVKGMLWVYLIVGILNSIGLLILGVDYAILFGMVTAVMTIIPYVGIILSSILPITMIWIEKGNLFYPLGVIGVFSIVQYVEASIIFPYIVGKQLGVNTLISISAIFIGGVIWGASGMILSLTFVAILKIISSHIMELKVIYKLLKIPD